jgi:hypothetical protein
MIFLPGVGDVVGAFRAPPKTNAVYVDNLIPVGARATCQLAQGSVANVASQFATHVDIAPNESARCSEMGCIVSYQQISNANR